MVCRRETVPMWHALKKHSYSNIFTILCMQYCTKRLRFLPDRFFVVIGPKVSTRASLLHCKLYLEEDEIGEGFRYVDRYL